jgi:hypothetical protein
LCPPTPRNNGGEPVSNEMSREGRGHSGPGANYAITEGSMAHMGRFGGKCKAGLCVAAWRGPAFLRVGL